MNLKEQDKKYILSTYDRNYVNFTKGINATIYDDKDNDYIDFTSGIGVVSVGHGNKQVADAIYNQVSNITHISNLYAIEPQAKLAKKIVDLSGYDMRCFFANSGAEANEGAIKIARKYGEINFDSKKYKIVTLGHSFHGRTITTIKASGQKKMHTNNFAPYPDGFSYKHKLDDLYKEIDDKTVGVMIELIQGEGGVQPFDKKDIQKLASFLKQKDILLIVDEVQTGAFRTGEFLASNIYDITPDIITLAKGIGGGVPIGVVMTKHKDIFSFGDHGSTFGGNYLSTRASLEVCNILQDYKQSGKLDEHIDYFQDKLDSFYNKNKKLFYRKVGIGFMQGLRVNDEQTLNKIVSNAFDKGVLLLKAGKITLRFLPPLTISKDEIDEGFRRLEDAICDI